MHKVWDYIKRTLALHRSFIVYGLISVFVTVLDVVVCRLSEHFFNAVTANTMGVVVGFVVQYFLTAKHVYNTKNIKAFVVFLLTFFIGLIVANGIVYLSRTYLFNGSSDAVAFLFSKGASIVIPFFLTYYLRKKYMPKNEKERNQ